MAASPSGDEALPVRGLGLPARARVRDGRDFRRIYRLGRRLHGEMMVVVALPRREPGLRLGLSVSKDHGRAVRRNKIKRILREGFRLERPTLPGAFDLVIIPRPGKGKLVLESVRAELRQLLRKAADGGGRRRSRQGPAPRRGAPHRDSGNRDSPKGEKRKPGTPRP